MAELLLELGCEELPASSVRKAYTQLEEEILNRLESAGVHHGNSKSLGTPRRLIVQIEGIADKQADIKKTMRGPSVKAAYGTNGNPTPALLGFCKSQNIDPKTIYKEGEHVWVKLDLPGKSTSKLLQEILPAAIQGIIFEKTMRWGASRMRFARPIRWILACFDSHLIPFSIEHVQSDLKSFGHRFYTKGSFEAKTFNELLIKLRERNVEPDPKIRKNWIEAGALTATSGTLDLNPELVDENVFLTEFPKVLEGSFPEQYLKLPKEVLVTVMAKHQRFFPVFDQKGQLINKFISVYNSGVEEVVRQGNIWVLNSRFNDADFFYQEDSRLKFHDFLEKTERIIFHEKLGTIRQKAERLERLCAFIAELEGASQEEILQAKQAGLYAKADLTTGLVSELPELQGIIGAKYARAEGFEEPVCRAIGTHYNLQKTIQQTSEHQNQTPLGLFLLLADQVDKLTGYLGLGMTPSGSSDPFGMRRAASYLILLNSVRSQPTKSYEQIFRKAFEFYIDQGFNLNLEKMFSNLEELFTARYKALLGFDSTQKPFYLEKNQSSFNYIEVPTEFIDASLSKITLNQLLDPSAVLMRLSMMQSCAENLAYQGLVQAATRTINIVQAARQKKVVLAENEEKIDIENLKSETGIILFETYNNIQEKIQVAASSHDAHQLLQNLLKIEKPIHDFFEATMIMAEDLKAQRARLHLLQCCSELLLLAGDFSKLNLDRQSIPLRGQ